MADTTPTLAQDCEYLESKVGFTQHVREAISRVIRAARQGKQEVAALQAENERLRKQTSNPGACMNCQTEVAALRRALDEAQRILLREGVVLDRVQSAVTVLERARVAPDPRYEAMYAAEREVLAREQQRIVAAHVAPE